MSKTFVKDPREVVKSGDVVRVKVLDVDIPRKRISLTLRLDDEPAADGGGARRERREPREPREQRGPQSGGNGGGARRGAPQRQNRGGTGSQAPAGGGALADALRRAGLAGGDGGPARGRR